MAGDEPSGSVRWATQSKAGVYSSRSVEPELSPAADVDESLLDYVQTLTPLQRLLMNEAARELALALQEAGRKLHGDSTARPPEASR